MEKVKYCRQNEPLVFSKAVIDKLMNEMGQKWYEGYSLYSFYYYTAKWQGTNQPKATTNYVAKAFGWSDQKVQKTKKVLKKIGLIEDIVDKDDKGKVRGHFIKVNFIWDKETPINEKESTQQIHPLNNPGGGQSHPWSNLSTNALSTNNTNALSTNKEIYIVFDFWNEQKIIVHRDLDKFRSVINSALKKYSIDEIKEAILNYKKILSSSGYWWEYKWTLKEFLQRGLDKFLTVNKPFENFKRVRARAAKTLPSYYREITEEDFK